MSTKEWVEKFQDEGVKISLKYSVFNNTGITGAYYWVSDMIEITPPSGVDTIFHELSHWTGHKNRLSRDVDVSFWSLLGYAKEELIAWESTQILGFRLGFELDEGSRKYFSTGLQKYPKITYKREGQKAANYLIQKFSL